MYTPNYIIFKASVDGERKFNHNQIKNVSLKSNNWFIFILHLES